MAIFDPNKKKAPDKAEQTPPAPQDNAPLRLMPEVADAPRPGGPENVFQILPVNVDKFDNLLADGGIERGLTILISGGAGTGKTTFCMQSLYYSALAGQKGVYISFEEDPVGLCARDMSKPQGYDG
jgi:ABC-type siderophore export system fused ATPase/permease subunit